LHDTGKNFEIHTYLFTVTYTKSLTDIYFCVAQITDALIMFYQT